MFYRKSTLLLLGVVVQMPKNALNCHVYVEDHDVLVVLYFSLKGFSCNLVM